MDAFSPKSLALCTEGLVCVLLVWGCVWIATSPRQHVQVCALVVVVWFLLSEGSESALAQTTQATATGTAVTAPQTFPTVLRNGVQLPDWSQISFSSMDPFSESGSVTIPPDLTGSVGFDSVTWQQGQKIADVLPLGAISNCLGVETITQRQIDGITGQLSKGFGLNQFMPAGLQSIQSLTAAVPDLAQKTVGEVQPISDLVQSALAGKLPGVGNLSNLPGLSNFAKQVAQAKQIVDTAGRTVGSLANGQFLDATGQVVGQVNNAGQVLDPSSNVMGSLNPSGEFVNTAGQVVGQISTGQVLDSGGHLLGNLNQAGQLMSNAGPILGQVNQAGQVVDQTGQVVGQVANAQLGNILQMPIGQLVSQFPELGNLGLGNLDRSKYTMGQIPNLDMAKLSDFANWEKVPLKGIPGLDKVPFSQFPNALSEGPDPYIARVDVPLDREEQNRDRSLSGSYQEGFRVACSENCEHAELSPIAGSQMDAASAGAFANGKSWMSRTQPVSGGEGPLKVVNGGKEPTGRNPYCSMFKQVITKVDQPGGKVGTSMYFRVCKHGIPDLGCTPYFIGPIPFLTYAEKQYIYLGESNPKDDGGGITFGDNGDPLSSQDGFTTCGGTLSGDAVDKAVQATDQVARSLGGEDGAFSTSSANSSRHIPLILKALKDQGITCPAQVAYVLATVHRETSFVNFEEGSTRYESDSQGYWGRGYVQITHKEAYQTMSQVTGQDLVSHPELAKQPDIAAKILAYGFKHGSFGIRRGIDQMIPCTGQTNWVQARQMINDSAQAQAIAKAAQIYYNAINNSSGIANAQSNDGGCGDSGAPITAGSINDRIYKSALSLKGKINQCANANTSQGNEGCQYAVNQVLQHAGIAPMGGPNAYSIVDTENACTAGRCQKIDPSQAQPGDIVIVDDGAKRGHIGICTSAGCRTSLSNSSSWCGNHNYATGTAGGFVYEDDGRFSQSYSPSIPRYIYRVIK